MLEQLTERDCKIISILLKGKGDWDYVTTAGGFANRKSAQKAARRVTAKLPLPNPPTGSPTTQLPTPQATRKPQTTRPKTGGLRSNASAGRPSTSKKDMANPSDGQTNVEEEGQGLDREGVGEGEAQSMVEGVGQGMDQGFDRFVVGRPYNEKVDRDFRQSHRDALRADHSSEDEEEEEHDNDDDDDDEMEW
ncbi:hypothetical protein D0859_16922 [Hortaea werneckii]|uniref:Uncharacterized protein n=1 Tax=Hortaea werneckii TaxID=91943 RepID=A0A3M7I0V8_HORWE|nr:hypothetical protein D0859_16922 [Hortaea werneckii]